MSLRLSSARAVTDLSSLAQLSSSKSRFELFWLSLVRAKIVKLTIPAPYRHERKFSGTPVCSHLIYIQSFGTLGQPFKIPPLSDQICHSAGVVGVPNNLFWLECSYFFYLGPHAKFQNPRTKYPPCPPKYVIVWGVGARGVPDFNPKILRSWSWCSAWLSWSIDLGGGGGGNPSPPPSYLI